MDRKFIEQHILENIDKSHLCLNNHIVYGLVDPDTKELRYVGRSSLRKI